MQNTYRTVLALTVFSSVLLSQISIADNYIRSIKVAGHSIVGSESSDNLNGSHGNDRILSGGVSLGRAESIRTRWC